MQLTARAFENRAILVVEDDDDVCRDLVDKLKQSGARVVGPAGSAIDALLLMEHVDIDAALIDMHVDPDASTAIASRLLDDEVPFVFATSENCSELPDKFQGFVVDDVADLQVIANTLFPPH